MTWLYLDQLFEGYNYGHDCHHYAHAANGHDPHDVGRSRHCLQDVQMPKVWGRLMLPIYPPFHHRHWSKIHPRKNHNYYYVCMSTAFIKGRLNPVGFTDCSPQVFANFQPAQLFSTSPASEGTIFNQPKPKRTDENILKKAKLSFFFSILKYSCWFFLHRKGPAVYFLVVCPKSN